MILLSRICAAEFDQNIFMLKNTEAGWTNVNGVCGVVARVPTVFRRMDRDGRGLIHMRGAHVWSVL